MTYGLRRDEMYAHRGKALLLTCGSVQLCVCNYEAGKRHTLVLGHLCFPLYFFYKTKEFSSSILTHFLMVNE